MDREIKFRIPKQTGLSLARSIYDIINQEFFDGALPKIAIKICKLEDSDIPSDYQLGAQFCVTKERKAFYTMRSSKLKHHSYAEERISIHIDNSALYFTDSYDLLFKLIDLLFHEMVHEHCYLRGIRDCNHDTQYHNAQFMIEAENHGLICNYDEKYGFNQTLLSTEVSYRTLDALLGDGKVVKQICDNLTAFCVSC